MFFWTSSEYLLCSTRESASCSFGSAWGNTFWLNCYLWVSCSFKIVASWWVAFIKNPCLLTFGTWQVLNLHPCCIICALGPEVVSVSVSVLRAGNMRLCCKTESHYSWDLLWPDIPQLSAACLFIHLCSVNVMLFLLSVRRRCIQVERSMASPLVKATMLTCHCCCFLFWMTLTH